MEDEYRDSRRDFPRGGWAPLGSPRRVIHLLCGRGHLRDRSIQLSLLAVSASGCCLNRYLGYSRRPRDPDGLQLTLAKSQCGSSLWLNAKFSGGRRLFGAPVLHLRGRSGSSAADRETSQCSPISACRSHRSGNSQSSCAPKIQCQVAQPIESKSFHPAARVHALNHRTC